MAIAKLRSRRKPATEWARGEAAGLPAGAMLLPRSMGADSLDQEPATVSTQLMGYGPGDSRAPGDLLSLGTEAHRLALVG